MKRTKLKLRCMFVTDPTGELVKVKTWGKQAEQPMFKRGDIVLFKKIEVAEFNKERFLSILWTTEYKVLLPASNLPEVTAYSEWWSKRI